MKKLIILLLVLQASKMIYSQAPYFIVGDTNLKTVYYHRVGSIITECKSVMSCSNIIPLDLDNDGFSDLSVVSMKQVSNHGFISIFIEAIKDTFFCNNMSETFTCIDTTCHCVCFGSKEMQFSYMFLAGDTLCDNMNVYNSNVYYLNMYLVGRLYYAENLYSSPEIYSWLNKGEHYIGFKWMRKGVPLFGWIRVEVTGPTEAKIIDFAIQKISIPKKLSKPIGDRSVCNNTISNYFVNSEMFVEKYLWSIEPDSAAIIEVNDTNAVLKWNSNFVGTAALKVQGFNYSGDSDFSDTLSIVVNSIPATPIATLNNGMLQSNETTGNQWYANYKYILDAENSNLIPVSEGNYFVIVTLNGCSSQMSNIISFSPTGINECPDYNGIHIFPNPTKDVIKISLFFQFNSDYSVEIYNNIGSLLQILKKSKSETNFDLSFSNYSAGFYIVHVYNTNKNFQIKVLKW